MRGVLIHSKYIRPSHTPIPKLLQNLRTDVWRSVGRTYSVMYVYAHTHARTLGFHIGLVLFESEQPRVTADRGPLDSLHRTRPSSSYTRTKLDSRLNSSRITR